MVSVIWSRALHFLFGQQLKPKKMKRLRLCEPGNSSLIRGDSSTVETVVCIWRIRNTFVYEIVLLLCSIINLLEEPIKRTQRAYPLSFRSKLSF